MGNTCAGEQSTASVKTSVKREPVRHPGSPISIASTQPPQAPRNIDEPRQISVSIYANNIAANDALVPIDWTDEGGSPAIDVTKSQVSVREWLEEIDGSNVTDAEPSVSPDSPDANVDDVAERLANMWVLPPPPSHYDADEDAKMRRYPVVSAISLETPKLPPSRKGGCVFF